MTGTAGLAVWHAERIQHCVPYAQVDDSDLEDYEDDGVPGSGIKLHGTGELPPGVSAPGAMPYAPAVPVAVPAAAA